MNITKELTKIVEELKPDSIYINLRVGVSFNHYTIMGDDISGSTRSFHIFYSPDKYEFLTLPPEFKTSEFDEVVLRLKHWALGAK